MDSFATIRLPGLDTTKEKAANSNISRTASVANAEFSDEALVSHLCDGDKSALGILFRRHAPLVRGIACES